jgi:hypothetical protein
MGVMGPAEVAILETFVVPRFLTLFGETALRVILSGDGAAIAHLGCRTGYPDRELVSDISNCSLVGVDGSAAAVELARNKAATLPGGDLRYYHCRMNPSRTHCRCTRLARKRRERSCSPRCCACCMGRAKQWWRCRCAARFAS